MSDHIKTYIRIKPVKLPSGYFEIDKFEENRLTVHLPEYDKAEYVDNTKLNHSFCFNGIIDSKSNQEQVFELIGLPSLENVFEGYNSTVS